MSINWKKVIGVSAAVLGTAFVTASVVSKKKKPDTVYDNELEQKNPLEGKKVVFVENEEEKENADGVKGHLEAVGDSDHKAGIYEKYVKRGIDIALSFGGLVVLSPVFAAVALAIKIEDPGPVLFTQKRVGQNKQYFKLHKFRSMKMCTPHDVPTHMLDNPDQYITKVGKFIRAHSLDELPQIWDIFVGNMSVIGPRPGLWNQDLLTAERDKYGANDVKPGLTGWAQINGRDELEIPDKAKLDGDYVQKIGPAMDIKCFLGSVGVFAKDDSVVEGGTGEMSKIGRHYTDGKSDEDLIGHIGFGEPVEIDIKTKKKVLITGAGSYIGESFKTYAEEHYPALEIDTLDMLDSDWRDKEFSDYDIVYHVAGIAHADVGNVDDATKEKYYAVNTDLAVEVCEKAKTEGVKEFIFMSSMIVYGDSAPYGKTKIVDEHTVPKASNFYGDSKLQVDVAVRDMADNSFKVLVIRPPMIYGKGSKGNYPTLAKLAKKLPVFPDVDNERSMLHIDNLCEFLCQIMLVKEIKENAVVLIPQNAEWTKTSDMVKEIAEVTGNKIRTMKIMKPAVWLGGKMPGKIGGLVNKAFGNSCYAHEMSDYEGISYRVVDLKESIKRTEALELIAKETIGSIISGENLKDDLVSIVMPAYNCADYILRTIQSVQAQYYSNWELIIVNDCSTDDTDKIIKECIKEDSRIIYAKNEVNSGAAISRNKAVELATGQYLAFIDSDDVWKPSKLEKQIQFMKKNNYQFTCTSYDKIDENDINLNRVINSFDVLDYNGLLKHCPGNSTVIYDAKALGKHIIPNIRKRNDYVMWLQVIKEAGILYGLNEVLSSHRVREGSISSNKVSLVKFHWYVYRRIQGMSLFKSMYMVGYWIMKGLLHKQ